MAQDWLDSFNKSFIPKGVRPEKWRQMSLAEQLKMSFEGDGMNIMANPWTSRLGMVYVWFSTLTYLYVILRHIIPEYFEDYSSTSRYYMKVFFTFIVVQALINWLCMYFYTSVHRKSEDTLPKEAPTPVLVTTDRAAMKGGDHTLHREEPYPVHNGLHSEEKYDQRTNGARKILMEDIYSSKTGLLWNYCDKCNLMRPPRAHHCKVCKACILKRDHHCFFANTCIGFYNQRYFVVFLIYMLLGCFIGIFLETGYLRWKLADSSWWDFLLPVTLKKYITGELPLYYTYMMVHMYSFIPMGIMCTGLLVSQVAVIATGKTTYEVTCHVRIKSVADTAHNFRSVFGAFWAINILFPAVIVFRQEGNGKYWSDMKKF